MFVLKNILSKLYLISLINKSVIKKAIIPIFSKYIHISSGPNSFNIILVPIEVFIIFIKGISIFTFINAVTIGNSRNSNNIPFLFFNKYKISVKKIYLILFIVSFFFKINLYNKSDIINKKYSKYSLGTKQKLGIAQVLMEDPKLIVLDEPLNGIENDTAKEVRKILNEEKKKDKIIIVASHIKEDIDTLADVVYNIDNGIVEKIKG